MRNVPGIDEQDLQYLLGWLAFFFLFFFFFFFFFLSFFLKS